MMMPLFFSWNSFSYQVKFTFLMKNRCIVFDMVVSTRFGKERRFLANR